MKSDYPADQPLLNRLLELIHLLRPPGQTKKWLARHFDCSFKTIGRYLKTLEASHFLLDEDERKRQFIVEPLHDGITVRLMAGEAELIYDLINSAAPDHRLATPILSKLLFYTELGSRVVNTHRRVLPEIIQCLSHAMKLNRQVKINQYESAISGRVRQRKLQPLNFTSNFNYLVAYEEAEGIRVNLKIDRISQVVILDEPCTASPDVVVDIFHMAANDESYEIRFLLSHLARRLLIEQLPESLKHITESGDRHHPYRFSAKVFSLLPVGRFYLGLPGHVVVEGPEALRAYLRNKITEFIL